MSQPLMSQRDRCQYPKCEEEPVEDLCPDHSLRWGRTPRRLRDDYLMPNDGIIDWTAVEVAAQGARKVRLTWVERELAAIHLYSQGHKPRDIEELLGFRLAQSRWQKIRDLIGENLAA